MSPPSPLRAFALLALAVSLAACSDTAAPALRVNRPAPSVLLRAGTAFNLRLCVDDVLDRVAPALAVSDDLSGIKNSLSLVNAALGTRIPPQLTTSSQSFKEALDAYFAARPERVSDPDAAVLRLLLDDLVAVAAYPPLDTLRTP